MKKFCEKGHDLSILGQAKQGWCIACKREYERAYHAKHRDERNAKNRREAMSPERIERVRAYDRLRGKETGDRHIDREKRLAWWRQYNAKNGRAFASTLSRHRISKDQYDAALESQNGCCAICLKPETVVLRGKVSRLAVDHNHQTGKFRALLCAKCNRALGMLGEDLSVIYRLASYVQRHSPVAELKVS